jgi:glycosyltransferase involved in cell wall biosynthesis
VSNYDEQSIADVINSFNKENINEMKRLSLQAAKELNWQVEQEKILALYKEISR